MALKKCKECDKEISTQAKSCPNCGVKVMNASSLGRNLMSVGLLLLLLPFMILFIVVIVALI